MSTLDQIGERVTKVERLQESHSATLDLLAANQIELVKITARLDKSLARHGDWMANHEERMATHEERMGVNEGRMAKLEEGLEEMRRFNRQTRRLFVLIARKADWLDDDEITQWENDND